MTITKGNGVMPQDLFETGEHDGIKVGDYVRSYDFVGTDDCYIEGTLIGFTEKEGCMRYSIRCEKDVIHGEAFEKGEDSRVGHTFYPPLNGTPSLFGTCNYVKKVTNA